MQLTGDSFKDSTFSVIWYILWIDQLFDNVEMFSEKKNKREHWLNVKLFSRNKDGFLTMGEIKLVNKNATKNEIKVKHFRKSRFISMKIFSQETIQEYDFDKDGKLNTAEYHQVVFLLLETQT